VPGEKRASGRNFKKTQRKEGKEEKEGTKADARK
jgi:hypothetical protein